MWWFIPNSAVKHLSGVFILVINQLDAENFDLQ